MPPAWFTLLKKSKRTGRPRPSRREPGRAGGRRLRLESLEVRSLLSVSAVAEAVPYHVAVTQDGVVPLSTAAPTGYSPAQIRHAYGFDQITFNNGTVAGDGSGTTIAIVDAYDDPRIANDLHQFDLYYGLPDPPNFTKVNQNGGTSLPAANAGWITEIALDVEWAHAIAPGASILLVEAASASMTNLLTAVNYARNAAGVVAVSMSWGGGEFSGEQSYDSYFTTPSGHIGVTFLAASGDSGSPVGYPAISPNVVAVGGTTLTLGAGGSYGSESGWSGSGGGISAYEAEPAYQQAVVTQTSTFRTNPDVAYDANPSTGFSGLRLVQQSRLGPLGAVGRDQRRRPAMGGTGGHRRSGADAGRPGLAGRRDPDPPPALLALQRRLPRHHQRREHRQPTLFGRARLRSGDRPGEPRGEPGRRRPGGRAPPRRRPAPPRRPSRASWWPRPSRRTASSSSNEQGVVSWAASYSSPITVESLTVDGASVGTINGPYGPYSGGVYYFSGVFGPLAAGTHTYRISMTDCQRPDGHGQRVVRRHGGGPRAGHFQRGGGRGHAAERRSPVERAGRDQLDGHRFRPDHRQVAHHRRRRGHAPQRSLRPDRRRRI